MMGRLWFVVLGTTVLLAACGSGDPEISLEPTRIDFGEVINGEIRSAEATVSNQGSTDLVIEAISTSCGCTTAQVDRTVIPAGEAGTLIVQFDSGAHGPEETGPIARQVFIASNDRLHPEFVLEVSATVLPRP
jgi:hypothetical protein